MHGHVSKRVKMHRKRTGNANKHGKHVNTWSGKEERYARCNPASRDTSQMVTSTQGLMEVRCNRTTTNLQRASNVAKPRTRKANMENKA